MTSVTTTQLKQAIEGRDARALTGFYADDAVMRIIDRDHPPSAPLELHGKGEIRSFYEDVCGRAMTHHVDSLVADHDHLAFTQACAYPDGARVFSTAMLTLADGLITDQTNVQAWDG
jgi:ketosteroid isomerase-like protein